MTAAAFPIHEEEAVASPRPRACPACDADRARVLFDNAMVGIGRFGFGYPVVACAGCGAVYASRVLDAPDLAAYYRTMSKYDVAGGAPSALDAHRATMAVDFVARVAGREVRLLDIGCSTGTFLRAARATGFARVSGIEPAPGAVDVCRQHGLDVSIGDANTLADFGRYDVVTLLAVLEHLAEPRVFVDEVARSMRPGATIVIEVPDAEAFGTYEDVGGTTEPFGEFSIEHINFFGAAAIAHLGRAAGLGVAAVEPFGYTNGARGVLVALRKGGSAQATVDDDERAARSILRYAELSDVAMRDVDRRLGACGSVVVYGAGSHSARLLARDAAARLDVRAIVDRNRNLTGHAMAGCAVRQPEAIATYPGLPVVVSTFNARAAVAAIVSTQFGNPVVPLYRAP